MTLDINSIFNIGFRRFALLLSELNTLVIFKEHLKISFGYVTYFDTQAWGDQVLKVGAHLRTKLSLLFSARLPVYACPIGKQGSNQGLNFNPRLGVFLALKEHCSFISGTLGSGPFAGVIGTFSDDDGFILVRVRCAGGRDLY